MGFTTHSPHNDGEWGQKAAPRAGHHQALPSHPYVLIGSFQNQRQPLRKRVERKTSEESVPRSPVGPRSYSHVPQDMPPLLHPSPALAPLSSLLQGLGQASPDRSGLCLTLRLKGLVTQWGDLIGGQVLTHQRPHSPQGCRQLPERQYDIMAPLLSLPIPPS